MPLTADRSLSAEVRRAVRRTWRTDRLRIVITAAASNAMLDALLGADDIWVQLHTGDPGDGTANVAGEAGRAAATFDRAENGMVASNVNLEWTMTANSMVSHVSLWTARFAAASSGRARCTTRSRSRRASHSRSRPAG